MNNLRSKRRHRLCRHGFGWLVRFVFLTGYIAALWTGQIARASATPELEPILLRVIENAAKDQEAENLFKTRYAFVRTKVTETRDGDGDLKKRTVERIENRPGASPDGEDAKDGEGAAADPKAEKRGYERRDFEIKPELLKRFRFTFVGAGEWNGRPVWVIDFVPASDDLPAHSIKERFINKTAGRLWIDQAERVLAKATFHLVEPVSVVGGLVGAVKKCEVETQRQRTQDGLWYPRLLVWHLEGRRLFWSKTLDHRDEVAEVRPAATAYAVPATAVEAE